MIPRSSGATNLSHWDRSADDPAWSRRIITRLDRLLQVLELDAADLELDADPQFPLRVPEAYAARMRRRDPRDPLLLQVLPAAAERRQVTGFSADPLAEAAAAATAAPGSHGHRALLRKYHGRSLLLATGHCSIHCRFCFRRHFPYPDPPSDGDFAPLFRTLAGGDAPEEIILSGGDPLTLPEARLETLLRALGALPGLRRLRIHSREPIVMPARITPRLVAALAAPAQPLALVVHCNHPQELDPAVTRGLADLRQAGVTLLNQSVLLAGVNDCPETLGALSERLYEAGVLPYYLHQLDPVAGGAHFAVPDARALTLWDTLCSRLPGYLVPRLVREIPGAPGKTWLAPAPAAGRGD